MEKERILSRLFVQCSGYVGVEEERMTMPIMGMLIILFVSQGTPANVPHCFKTTTSLATDDELYGETVYKNKRIVLAAC